MGTIADKTEQLDRIAKRCQKCLDNPVIVLGSGASIPHGVRGMGPLAAELKAKVETSTTDDEKSWQEVLHNMKNGAHLEAALEGVPLSSRLIDEIMKKTWLFIAGDDFKVFQRVVDGTESFPLSTLLSHLFQSSNRTINLITPNYDRVVEYAASLGGFIVNTGFLPGYYGSLSSADVSYQVGKSQARTVRVWKVHGSLDWFRDRSGKVLSLPLMAELLDGLSPQIVTPGVSKFQETHNEPYRSAIQGADAVLRDAASIICIGYGFRDQHLQPKLIERCRSHNIPVLLSARTLTDEARSFLRNKAGQNYVGLEMADEKTRVFTAQFPDGEIIDEENLWELRRLTELLF